MFVVDCPAEIVHRRLSDVSQAMGDITQAVSELLYREAPDVEPAFTRLSQGSVALLEGSMVEQVIYCIMDWHDAREEIELKLINTIPHHVRTLSVSVAHFVALVDAVFSVIMSGVPHMGDWREVEFWKKFRKEMSDFIACIET